MQLKIDFHVHTCYSHDSVITPEELVFYAKKHGLDSVAVTDHDKIEGALKIAKKTNYPIIVGVEISSRDGHVLGLNIKEPIPKGLSADETVDRIHGASGIAVACHPTALFKGSLSKNVNAKFDAFEVINSSAIPFGYLSNKNRKIASNLGIAQVAGSDAHYSPEIGCAYTLVEAELKIEEIIEAVRRGLCQPFGRAIPLTLRLKREALTLKRKLGV
ncbi:MAG: CehA/McbA family metallohydrolase [Candidatus Bathyarchaeia archaeon]